jgi:hypothetical protein
MNKEFKKIPIEQRLLEIDQEIDKLDEIVGQKDNVWDRNKPFEEWWEHIRPEQSKISELSRERRMIMPYELSKLSDFGDVMSLEHFIDNVKCGGFIDYDGYGHYIKYGQETNVEIHPSDVKNNSIRKEFDTIIWFNR